MKKYYINTIRKGLLILVLAINSFYINAQCPTIAVSALATPSVFCAGTTSQLSVTSGIAGGGYSVVQVPFAPVPGTGTAVSLTDDQMSAMMPIGFNFTFFGSIYSQFNICSNGYISFNPLSYATLNLTLPTANPNTVIAGAAEDLNPPQGGTIEYFNTGLSPNRKLIVNFTNIQHYPSGNPVTFQIVLFESSNVIQIHTTSVQGPIATEGIQDSTITNYLVVPGRNYQAWTATNEAWQFSPGNPVLTYSWSPATGLSNTNISNPVASPSVSTTYTVTATDTNACYGTATVSVYVSGPQISAAAAPNAVCAGSSTQLSTAVNTTSVSNYTVSPITYSPVSISGLQVSLTDDKVSTALPIGFNFNFYGNNYTTFYVSSNGFVTFDPTAFANNFQGCCAGQLLPNTNFPNNLIAGAWEDLNPAPGTVTYATTGSAPNRKLVVAFTNVAHSTSADSVTFQIICYETSNVVEIHTASMPGNPHGYWWGHTQGLENASGTLGVAVPGRNNNNTWTANNDACRFTPYSTILYSWYPNSTLSSDSISNPVATPVANTVYSVTAIDASGCVATASVPVTVNPLPAAPVITYSSFVLHSNYPTGNQWYLNGTYLIPGATGQNYQPGVIGNYTVLYTDANGCTSTSAPFNVTQLGIDEYAGNVAVTVFPNPFTNAITITVDNNYESEITIYDIASRKITSCLFNKSILLTTENYAKGVYFYEVKNNAKLVKKGKLNCL